jgi:oxygen-dependent protoporphyrinogen oxidase
MVLVPRRTDPDLPVIGLGHNLAPGRAPSGGGVLTAFWMDEWSRAHWEDSDDAVVAETEGRIRRLLPSWELDVQASHVTRWQPALVASRPGIYQALAEVQQHTDPRDPIQLAGDWFAQSSVNASVASGEVAAKHILDQLGLRSS